MMIVIIIEKIIESLMCKGAINVAYGLTAIDIRIMLKIKENSDIIIVIIAIVNDKVPIHGTTMVKNVANVEQ